MHATRVIIHDSANPSPPSVGGTQVFVHDQNGDPSRQCKVVVHEDGPVSPEIAPGVRLGDLSGTPRPTTKVVLHDTPNNTKVILHEKKPPAVSETDVEAPVTAVASEVVGTEDQ